MLTATTSCGAIWLLVSVNATAVFAASASPSIVSWPQGVFRVTPVALLVAWVALPPPCLRGSATLRARVQRAHFRAGALRLGGGVESKQLSQRTDVEVGILGAGGAERVSWRG